MAKILLAPDELDPDKQNIDSRKPLSFATKNGHERVVALLRSRNTVVTGTPCREGNSKVATAPKLE